MKWCFADLESREFPKALKKKTKSSVHSTHIRQDSPNKIVIKRRTEMKTMVKNAPRGQRNVDRNEIAMVKFGAGTSA